MRSTSSSVTFLLIISLVLLTGCGKKTIEQLTTDYGVIVDGGSFDKDSVLISNKIESSSIIGQQILSQISVFDYDKEAGIHIFDIYVELDGSKIQPNGKVKVTIPLPNNDITSGIILHIKDNMQIERIVPNFVNGKIIFETSSFSYFVLVSS